VLAGAGITSGARAAAFRALRVLAIVDVCICLVLQMDGCVRVRVKDRGWMGDEAMTQDVGGT